MKYLSLGRGEIVEGFGKAVRKLRLEAGLDQRDLAAAAGYHQSTISAVERTERIPGIDVLLGVCRALAVTPDQLFRRAGLLPAEGEIQDEGFWELWGVYKRLTAEEREVVIDFALFWEGRRG